MNFIVVTHIKNTRLFLDVIDPELKDKCLQDEKKIIDLTKEYYKGEEFEEENLKALIEKAFSINFIGNKSVEFALKNNLIDKHSQIQDIKYAHMVRF